MLYAGPMSGGGGSGPYDSGPRKDDCNIVETVPLNSPKAAVVSTLKVGDELEVALSANKLSLEARKAGVVAGALTPSRLADLLDCINQGKSYKAVVRKLAGGNCTVEIRPK